MVIGGNVVEMCVGLVAQRHLNLLGWSRADTEPRIMVEGVDWCPLAKCGTYALQFFFFFFQIDLGVIL
ncbi:unnamed protein product, partial [Vitis vinifera]|uniref:Uncharacterized protein n=1 Tax=Vitis vinifera TaxID=29760 RepID=D7TCX4_VITVI